MKAGILTFHRAHNYGAVLQCYALQEVVRKMGLEVEIIDYRQPYIENVYHVAIEWRYIVGLSIRLRLRTLHGYIHSLMPQLKRAYYFNFFRSKFLYISIPFEKRSIPQIYDRYIIGSDQMWGLHCTKGFEPIYWGDFERPNDSKIYGYAISSNGDYVQYLSPEQIKNYISGFEDITFRETTIRNNIFELTGVNKNISLDPTLLTDSSDWDKLIEERWKNRKFIAIYNIRDFSKSGAFYEIAKRLSDASDFEIIDFSQMTYSVSAFVSAMKYAQCVLTSSFHATAFSIIFGTPFYSFKFNDGHDGRYSSLLKALDLHANLVELNASLHGIPFYDTNKALLKLEEMKKESLSYLSRILQK